MSSTAPTVLDAWSFPDGVAADLAQWAPQASLLPVLDELVPAMLTADGRVDALVAVERYIAMLQARSTELLSALDAGDTSDDQFTRDSVAAALRLPPASMKARMTDARDLADAAASHVGPATRGGDQPPPRRRPGRADPVPAPRVRDHGREGGAGPGAAADARAVPRVGPQGGAAGERPGERGSRACGRGHRTPRRVPPPPRTG